MKFRSHVKTILIVAGWCYLMASVSGCANFGRDLKNFLGGGSSTPPPQQQKSQAVKYSDQPEYMRGPKRAYKRMSRERLQESEQLDGRAGSLWVMEGQGSYLFAENTIRMIGDSIPVKLDGDPKSQLDAKVGLISKLLKKIEDRRQASMKRLAEEDKQKDKKEDRKPAQADKPAKEGGEEKQKEVAGAEAESGDFAMKTVPARVVERTVDGNYRIKGSQPFMVGRKEYKVIVTGLVRPEDFNEEGVPSSKLLDSKFDIVSAKKKEEEM